MTQFDDRGDAQRLLAQRLVSLRGDMRLFDDRVDAGLRLAERLKSLRGQDIVVLGLAASSSRPPTGCDLTQLIVGSEGSLALVTEATLKLQPRLPHSATLLAPFTTLEQVTAAVPKIVQSGVGPLIQV